MRIVLATGLDQGIHEYGNMGDISMLQVAVSRLMNLWPSANIEVLTTSATKLAKYCPGTKPLTSAGWSIWVGDDILLGRYSKLLPERTNRHLIEWKNALEIDWPRFLRLIVFSRLWLRNRVADISSVKAFVESMDNTDLLVVCGAGGFDTHCRAWNITILSTIEMAMRLKIPVAMMGQGMGPLDDPVVLSRAKRVLPKVNLITLRGSRGGLALLESLGVAPSQVQTTGDESVELAYEARSKDFGQALGINLRIADSAETDKADIERISNILQQFARRHNVAMIPVPIAFHPYGRDDLVIKQLLAGFDDQSDGGLSLDTPLKVIQQVGRCRVVVTGAYHAAVFALGQGIPVVGLVKSPYYITKFLGLEDLFGNGCETILLNEAELEKKLYSAIERAWKYAEKVRVPLRQAALGQIELSRGAYEQVKVLLASRTARRH